MYTVIDYNNLQDFQNALNRYAAQGWRVQNFSASHYNPTEPGKPYYAAVLVRTPITSGKGKK